MAARMCTKMANKWAITLNTGAVIPAFGLGTWQSKKGEVGNAVEVAIRAGYRHLDCAHRYRNEDEIGEALQKVFKEGVVKREDLYITSKLSFFYMLCKEDIYECCETVLKNLQTNYLDLFLVHAPFAVKKDASLPELHDGDVIGYDPANISAIWEVMEELVSKGMTKAIGISNFTITKTANLLKTAKIVPAVNQVECHPYLQQSKLRDFCKSKGIAFESYAPLGSPTRMGIKPDDPVVMEDPVIKELAVKYNASPAQICIAFLLHLGLIVIPKSATESHIIENLKATEITLTSDEIEKLKGLDKNARLFTFSIVNPGKTLEEIWDMAQDEAYQI